MGNAMPTLPTMPKANRKAKPEHDCFCGCGGRTKSTWTPGHDGRATGWAIRVERGIMKLDEVPANERKGADWMLKERASKAAAKAAKTA